MAYSRLRKLQDYLRPHWKDLFWGIFSLFVVNAIGIYIPLLIRDSIDGLRVAFSFDRIWQYVILIFVLATIMWFIRMASRIILFGLGRQVEFDLKQRVFQHLLTLEPAYFARNTAGDLINRATSDIDNIRRLLGFAILSLANTFFAYTLTFPVMLGISWWLSLMTIAIYPVMLFSVSLFSNKLRTQQQKVQEELSTISELVQEDMSGISLIKIYAQEANEQQAFREVNQRLLDANLKLAQTRNVLFPVVEALAYVSLLILLWLGTGAIARGSISIGDFVALLIYAERLVFPTALLGFTITAYQRGEVSIDRIETILMAEPEIADLETSVALPREKVQGKIEARHLNFSFSNPQTSHQSDSSDSSDSKVDHQANHHLDQSANSQTAALVDVNFQIEPGETIAIVGSIGAGKSTIANALTRLLDIAPGQLFLDGYDITQINLQDLRRAIAYVPQESFLFSDSMKNNIRYGDPVAGDSEVIAAAQEAQIHGEILNFPKEYATIVGERGITLSGGQRQRTSLARALLVDAPVLILDDSLSSVDNQTATEILRRLSQGTQRKTVIFISHQLSAAAQADRILVMDKGKIVQGGTHNELVATEGLYRSLWYQHQLEEILK
jgi:ATP-binding cassette, subfamily B, multidrug efflux pump